MKTRPCGCSRGPSEGARVLFVFKARVRKAADRVVAWAKKTLTVSFRPLPVASGLVGGAFRSRQKLQAENMLLRQQLKYGFFVTSLLPAASTHRRATESLSTR